MAKGFEINPRGVRQLQKAIEKEFAKNPVKVPIVADAPTVRGARAAVVNNYHAPVVTVNGDNAQVAFDNESVAQNQARVENVAEGYAELAKVVGDIWRLAPQLHLEEDDEQILIESAEQVLNAVTAESPDDGLIRRGITMLKGVLAPIVTGVKAGVSAEATDAVRGAYEALGGTFGS